MFPNSRICYLKDIINHATIKLLCKFKEKEFDNDEEEKEEGEVIPPTEPDEGDKKEGETVLPKPEEEGVANEIIVPEKLIEFSNDNEINKAGEMNYLAENIEKIGDAENEKNDIKDIKLEPNNKIEDNEVLNSEELPQAGKDNNIIVKIVIAVLIIFIIAIIFIRNKNKSM